MQLDTLLTRFSIAFITRLLYTLVDHKVMASFIHQAFYKAGILKIRRVYCHKNPI